MPKLDSETKAKILAAAEKVFHKHGLLGSRTTMIAEEAGISRTMLHYHYSTKDALFGEILTETVNTGLKHLKPFLDQENPPLRELIVGLVKALSNLFLEKPGMPNFIIGLMNENPNFAELISSQGQDNLPKLLELKLAEARDSGEVYPNVTGEEVILNLYAVCSFPFLMSNYIRAAENRSAEEMKKFLEEKVSSNIDYLLRGIFKNP